MLAFPLEEREVMSHLNVRESLTHAWIYSDGFVQIKLQTMCKLEWKDALKRPQWFYNISLSSCWAGALEADREGQRKANKRRKAFKKQSGYPVEWCSASWVEAGAHSLVWRLEGVAGTREFCFPDKRGSEARFSWVEVKIWSKEGKQTKDSSSNMFCLMENQMRPSV